jgi:hypothetical protein
MTDKNQFLLLALFNIIIVAIAMSSVFGVLE